MNANELLTLRSAMDRLFQDSLSQWQQRGAGYGYNGQTIVPPANAWEEDEQVIIELVLPGVRPDDVDITIEQDVLTVQGSFPAHDKEKKWILREQPTGKFRRRFTLQVPVEVNKVSASYRDGLLVLTLPRSEESKPRKITVKTA